MKPPVLCVPSALLPSPERGYSESEWDLMQLLGLIQSEGRLVGREEAESRDDLKQVVTYGIVRQQGRVLAYTRKPDHSRPELARLWSIGVGGHVDESDVDAVGAERIASDVGHVRDMLTGAIRRELSEEIPDATTMSEIIGIINTDEGAGRYHVGVVYEAEVVNLYRKVMFADELQGAAFIPPHRIEVPLLEPWSAILFQERLAAEAERSRAEEEAHVDRIFREYQDRRAAASK